MKVGGSTTSGTIATQDSGAIGTNPERHGIKNGGNTCWLNSCLQWFANTPSFSPLLKERRADSKLKPLYDALETYKRDPSTTGINTNQLRRDLAKVFILDGEDYAEEDPAILIQGVYDSTGHAPAMHGLTKVYSADGELIDQTTEELKEPLFVLNPPDSPLDKQDFATLFRNCLQYESPREGGGKNVISRTLLEAPSDFTVMVGRFRHKREYDQKEGDELDETDQKVQDYVVLQALLIAVAIALGCLGVYWALTKHRTWIVLVGVAIMIGEAALHLASDVDRMLKRKQQPFNIVSIKVQRPLDIPLEYTLTAEDCPSSQPTYQADCFIPHLGNSVNTGHYICYCTDEKGEWWRFNDDSPPEQISQEKIKKEIQFAYLVHYRAK